jgi:hypothetical protein
MPKIRIAIYLYLITSTVSFSGNWNTNFCVIDSSECSPRTFRRESLTLQCLEPRNAKFSMAQVTRHPILMAPLRDIKAATHLSQKGLQQDSSVDPEANAMEAWLLEMGAIGIREKVCIRRSPRGGRGLFATSEIIKGDCVLYLPPNLVLTEDTVVLIFASTICLRCRLLWTRRLPLTP